MHQHKNKNVTSSYESCFSKALSFLGKRDLSSFELEMKLKKQGFRTEHINLVILKCVEFDYINDKKFAENFFNYQKKKLYGPIKIKSDLLMKKIDADLVENLITLYSESDEEFVNAEKFFLKIKYKLEKKDSPQKRIQSFFSSISQRGFSKTAAYRIYEKYLKFFNKKYDDY